MRVPRPATLALTRNLRKSKVVQFYVQFQKAVIESSRLHDSDVTGGGTALL